MSYITCEEIEIDGFLPLNRVFSIFTKSEGNEHGGAVITAEMDKKEEGKIETLEKNQTISVHAKDRSKLKRNLFVGYLDEVNVLESEGIYDKIEIKLTTKSCVLDEKRKSRSFQDVSVSYSTLMKKAGQETGDIKVVCYQGENETIEMPIIQYLETNWQFIKRLASHFRASVYVDETVTGATLQIGIKQESGGEELDGRDTIWGISENYFQQDKDSSELSKKDFMYRKVVSDCNVKIASQVKFQGQYYYVQKKQIVTENSVIKFVYILGSSKLLECRTVYNEHLAGVSIIGEVLDVKNETMKLKLKLDDDQQDESTAYYYNWTPISGNLMYCMPEKGTSVSLYFPDADEKTGTLVDCIRLNGETNPKFSNPSDKYLTTDANKMLKMTEDVLEVTTATEPGDGHAFSMKSKESIYITSSSYISIKGLNVLLKGKSITVKMPVEISILQCKEGDATIGSTINNAEFNFSGEEISIDGILVTKYPLIDDEPEEGKLDVLGILKNVAVGLIVTAAVCAVAAAVTFFTFGTGAIFAGAVIGAAVAGVATTLSTAVKDAKSGKITDTKKLAGKVLLDSTVGAITGAIGGSELSLGKKFLADQIGNLTQTVGDDLIDMAGGDIDVGQIFKDVLWGSATSAVTFGLFEPDCFKAQKQWLKDTRVVKYLDDHMPHLIKKPAKNYDQTMEKVTKSTKSVENIKKEISVSQSQLTAKNNQLAELLEQRRTAAGAAKTQYNKQARQLRKDINKISRRINYKNRCLAGEYSEMSNILGKDVTGMNSNEINKLNALKNVKNMTRQSAHDIKNKAITDAVADAAYDNSILADDPDVNEINVPEQVGYVTRGAMMMCQYGTHPRRLNLKSDHGYTLNPGGENGFYPQPFIHEGNCIFGDTENITFFGVCNAPDPPDSEDVVLKCYVWPGGEPTKDVEKGKKCCACFGADPKWFNTQEDKKIMDGGDGYSTVLTNSYLTCTHGGKIEFLSSGLEYKGDKDKGEIEYEIEENTEAGRE